MVGGLNRERAYYGGGTQQREGLLWWGDSIERGLIMVGGLNRERAYYGGGTQ